MRLIINIFICLQIVAFSEVYYPEWEMQIDGNEQPIMKANYVIRAAYLPAGDHEIKMHSFLEFIIKLNL